MLPTAGHFREIDCPYFESGCGRPYCHFKHRKKIPETPEIPPPPSATPDEVPTYNPTPKSELAKARSHIPISYVPDLGLIRPQRASAIRSRVSSYTVSYDKHQPITYKPTPLSILSKSSELANSLILPNNENSNSSSECDGKKDGNVLPDLSDEFDMIDEIIEQSTCEEDTEDDKEKENNKQQEDEVVEQDNKEEEEQEEEIILTSKSKSKLKSQDDVQDSKLKNKHSSSDGAKHESHKSKSKEKQKSSKVRSDDKKDRKTSKNVDEKKTSKTHKNKEAEHKSLKVVEKVKSKSSRRHSSDKEEKSSKRCVGDKELSKSSRTDSSDKGRHNGDKEISKGSKQCSSDKEEHSRSSGRHNSKHKHRPHSTDKVKVKGHTSDKKRKERDKEHSRGKGSAKKIKTEVKGEPVVSSPEHNFDGLRSTFESDSEPDEPDIEEECYRIFNEYKPMEPEISREEYSNFEPVVSESELPLVARKRVAHGGGHNQVVTKTLFNKPKPLQNPAQTMMNRLKIMQVQQEQKETEVMMDELKQQVLKHRLELTTMRKPVLKTYLPKRKPVPQPSTSASSSLVDEILGNKLKPARRIAPVMNVGSIQRAKEKIEKMKAQAVASRTAVHTHSKSNPRVAHVPEFTISILPDLLEVDKSKLPLTIRNKLLKMLVEECYKLYISKEDGNDRAVQEEFKCYARCSALTTYKNSVMLAVSRLRKERQERDSSGLGPLLSGESTVSDKEDSSPIKNQKFYNSVNKYLLTKEELELHGFPREGTVPGRAFIKELKPKPKFHHSADERVCCRCSKLYKVDIDGFPRHQEDCLYHPLRKRTFRGETFYLCCRSADETGCMTSSTHVSEALGPVEGEVEGYQVTMDPERDDDPRSYAVYALDCEMCYTTKGLELTRVTVVNSDLKTVYETLVKPFNSIIDYNTQFSGITKDQMERTATSILQVQANILHLCNSKTILIGHSLESDMKALKIIHSSVIDTSVMFPHKFGLPHKRALRQLASEYLKKIIQNSVSGHDSAEDALSCMELVIWKLKEDCKLRGVKM